MNAHDVLTPGAMRALTASLVVLVVLVAYAGSTFAQETPRDAVLTELHVTSGEVFRGYVLGSHADSLRFRTLGGVEFSIPLSQLKEMRPLVAGGSETGTPTTEAPHVRMGRLAYPANSLFAMPTAYPIPAGEVHLGLYEVFFASGNVGVADIAELHAGTVLLPGLEDGLYYGGVKLSPIHTEDGALAIGTVYHALGDDGYLMFYGVGTLNLGASWLTLGYTTSNEMENGIATVGFDFPVSSVTRIMSELWVPVDGEGALLGVGARFETSFANIDIGFYIPTVQSGKYLLYLPWLGGTVIL